MYCVNAATINTFYTVHLSPALNKSSEILHFQRSYANKIRQNMRQNNVSYLPGTATIKQIFDLPCLFLPVAQQQEEE